MKKNITLLLLMLLSGVSTAWAEWTINSYTATSYTYDGTQKTFALSALSSNCSNADGNYTIGGAYLTYNSGTLIATAAGNYNVTINNGCTSTDHSGTHEFSWSISSYNISTNPDSRITINSPSATYSGTPITVDFTVTFKKGDGTVVTLTKGTDYTVDIGTVTNIGSTEITITGKGNFTGSVKRYFQVLSATETWVVNTYTASTVYNGITQYAKKVINITNSNCTNSQGIIDENTHTSVISGQQYAINAGSYTAGVKNTCSNHPGTYTFSWEILPYNVTGNNITVTLADQTWTGNELTVTPTVQFKNGNSTTSAITNNTDYSYYTIPETVKDPGEYTLVVEGMGNFTGSKYQKFYVKKNVNDATVGYRIPLQLKTTTDGTTYTMPATFSMEVKDGEQTLTEGTDYTLTFSTDDGMNYYTWGDESLLTAVGKYKVMVTGTGSSYAGTNVLDYYVANEYQTLGNVTYHITEPAYSLPAENGEVMIGAKTGTAIEANATTSDVQEQLDNQQTTVTILSTDFTFNVTGIEKEAFKNCTKLTTLKLPLTITTIEDAAFSGCTGLRWIDLNTAEGYLPTNFSRDESQVSPFRNLPRQTLVYLYGPTYSAENYVFRAGSTYTCDIFKIYDDISGEQTNFRPYHQADYKWAYQNDHNFTANTLINNRNFKAGRHYTVCLPYAIAIPPGTKAYTFEKAGTQLLGFKEVTGMLTAKTPYVLIPSVDGELLNGSNVQVGEFKTADDEAKILTPTTSGNYTFYGTLRYMEGTETYSSTNAFSVYIMQYKDDKPNWLKIGSEVTNDGTNPTNPCVLPMRAYIKYAAGGGARPYMAAEFVDNDGSTTTIGELELDTDDTSVYDLQGRRVNTPPARGVYIRNGKKVVVK